MPRDASDSDRRVALLAFVFEWYSEEVEPTEKWDPRAPQIARLANSGPTLALDALVAGWAIETDQALRRAKAMVAAERN